MLREPVSPVLPSPQQPFWLLSATTAYGASEKSYANLCVWDFHTQIVGACSSVEIEEQGLLLNHD